MAEPWQLKAVISANSTGMIKALTEAGKVAKTTRKYLLDIGSAAGNLAGKIGLPVSIMSGIAASLSIGAIKNAVVAYGAMGDAVYKGSIRTGTSVEQFQRMKYVAEQAGVGVEMLEGAMGKLNQIIGNVGAGKNKNVAELFKRLGIDVRDANGHIKAGVDILPQLADAFERNKDPAVQARMGMALFGRKWQEIAPMLMQGGAGIQESIDRMKKFKGVMPDDAIETARQLAKSMRDLDYVTNGFQMTIAKELVPVIEPLIKEFGEWVAENRKLVATGVKDFVTDLVESMRQIEWKSIIQGVKDFATSLGGLVDFVGGAKNALIGLVLFMNLETIAAFVGLLGATVRLGAGLVRFAVKSIPKVLGALGLYTFEAGAATVATDGLAASTAAADAAAVGWFATLKNVLGVLGSIAAAAAPLAVMWGVKNWAEDQSHDQERVGGIQNNMMKPAEGFLSMFGFDKNADIEERRRQNRADLDGGGEYNSWSPFLKQSQSPSPSLLNQGGQQNGGKFIFDFQNAPAGFRLKSEETKGNTTVDMNVGYSSNSLLLDF